VRFFFAITFWLALIIQNNLSLLLTWLLIFATLHPSQQNQRNNQGQAIRGLARQDAEGGLGEVLRSTRFLQALGVASIDLNTVTTFKTAIG
jgi:hypothetical protein